MLSSAEIRQRIEDGMIHYHPDNMQPDVSRILAAQWEKQLEAEGGCFDLTCAEFRELAPDVMPDIGPLERIEPKTRPIYWTEGKPLPYVRLRPNEYVLFRTREIFKIPPDIAVRLHRKSTGQRCGFDVLYSPAHPSYNGQLTLGLRVVGPLPITIRYGARLLTSSYWPVDAAHTTQYAGPHQGGVITSDGQPISPY